VGRRPDVLASPVWLDIPALGVSAPVAGIPFGSDGWDLTWLGHQIGWLEGSAYPTWPGNTALSAHAYLPSGLPGPFADLDTLRWGDSVVLRTEDAMYIYEVRERYETSPDDITPLYGEAYDWVTLITCRQSDEQLNSYRWRIVVRAVLVSVVDR
jgi:LPXTG-site transpeptidase (sortase) family protein